MVLSHITYDDGTNGTRPLFYRLSVAEMVVPVRHTVDEYKLQEDANSFVIHSTPRLPSLITESKLSTLGSTELVPSPTVWLSVVTVKEKLHISTLTW
jgi:hypothetical protein